MLSSCSGSASDVHGAASCLTAVSCLQLSEDALQAASDEAGQAMARGDYAAAVHVLGRLMQSLQQHEQLTGSSCASASAPAVSLADAETTACPAAPSPSPMASSVAAQQEILLKLATCHIHLGDPRMVGYARLNQLMFH